MGEVNRIRGLGLLFVGLLGIYGFFAHGYVENADVDVTMHAARAWYLRGDPGLVADAENSWEAERQIAAVIHATPPGYGMPGVNGKAYVWFPIGHQMLMVPFVALGELFAEWFPDAEAQYEARRGAMWGQFYWTRVWLSFLPALCAAGSTIMVLLIVHSLGCTGLSALWVTGAATLCTQFLPGASETMSDAPGMFFLLAMAALVFRLRAGIGGTGAALVAGLCGGWAALVRYPHGGAVLVLAAVVLVQSWQEKRWKLIGALSLGALPELVMLLAANYLRFGEWDETGYGAGANAEWWGYPWGLPLILFAPGKGILWFSAPLWIALPALFRRDILSFPWLPIAAIFAIPLVVFGQASGWAAGQCWSVRYLTPSVVLVVAVALAMTRPWERRPRLVTGVLTLSFLVSLGGVLTPYHAQQQLAYEAAKVAYPGAEQVDNNVNADPRFSPLHTHWIFAGLAISGTIEQPGAENTIGPLFGIDREPVEGRVVRLARPFETAGFRHWWMVGASHNHHLPFWPLFALWFAVTGAALFAGVRAVARRG